MKKRNSKLESVWGKLLAHVYECISHGSLVLRVSVLNVSVKLLSSLQGSSQCSGLFSVGSHILCCPCQQLEVWTLEHCLYVRECGSKLWLWVPFINIVIVNSVLATVSNTLPAVDHGLIDSSRTSRWGREAISWLDLLVHLWLWHWIYELDKNQRSDTSLFVVWWYGLIPSDHIS